MESLSEKKRELTYLDNEGNNLLVHTRWIGSKTYQVTKIVKNGHVVAAMCIFSEMTEEEKAKFDLEWNEKWNPKLSTETATRGYPSAINLVSEWRKTMVTDHHHVFNVHNSK